MEQRQAESNAVRWTARILRGRPLSAAFVALLIPAVGIGVYAESQNPVVALLAVGFLVVAVSPALFPTHYVLDDYGVTVKHLGKEIRRPWSAFRRAVFDGNLVLLSPYARPQLLEAFRGLYLRFDRTQEEVRKEAERFILAHLKRPEKKKSDERRTPGEPREGSV